MKNNVIGVIVAFLALSVILYMGLGMMASVPEPGVGTDEYDEYQSLSKIIDISYKGYYAVLLIIVVLAIILALRIGGKV